MQVPSDLPREVLEIREDVRAMRIRGAGRIARAAAIALSKAAAAFVGNDVNDFMKYMEETAAFLRGARPTAVSLPNAISFVMRRLRKKEIAAVEEGRRAVEEAAKEFVEYSERAVDEIGELGARRFRSGDVVMTHCHSSAAAAVLAEAHRAGKVDRVYVKETRPRLQGLIAARVLADAGLDVILIPDSAVRYFMKDVDRVIVGADAVAANGAVVNKVGTSVVALAAKEARVNFYVAAETYKFSPKTLIGELVPIEFRDPAEVVGREWRQEHPNVEVLNPVFDVTPAEYIDAIITERGVISPYAAPLILLEEYGVSAWD
ncbi:MAG: ribose 1,5-bisphosphate isomerase [Conexivisphaera sp.]